MNLAAAWEWLSGSPLFGITVTLAAFLLAHRLWERTGRHPSLNPLLVSMMLVAGVIVALRVPYERYAESAGIVTFLLGPATVALALPLHRQAARVREAAPMVLGAVVLGSVVALASGYLFTRWAGGDEVLALSMSPKSTTTPISLALGAQVGGVAALSALFTVVAGIIGAVIGPWVLTLFRVRDPRARGLAMGVASHGIGTARMLHDDPTAGAFSGLAMALTGLATSLLIGLLLPLLQV